MDGGNVDNHKIDLAAQKALEGLEIDKGGRPHEAALKTYINALAEIYERATGKKGKKIGVSRNKNLKYQGPFYKFVELCVGITDPKAIHSNVSLGQLIQRSLKYPRKQGSLRRS